MHRTRVCPNCGSTDINLDHSTLLSTMAIDPSYACENCGYDGIFPEVRDEDVDEHRQEVKQRGKIHRRIDEITPGRGRLYMGFLFLILGIPSSLYATWSTGRLAGLLALAVGASILFDYFGANL